MRALGEMLAGEHFGWLGAFFSMDLLADLDHEYYFDHEAAYATHK